MLKWWVCLATYHVKTNIEGEGAEKSASISTIMNRIKGGWAMSQSKKSWQNQGRIKASLKSPTYCSQKPLILPRIKINRIWVILWLIFKANPMWILVKFKLMEDITIPFKSRKDSTSSGKFFIPEVDCKLCPWQVLISSSHSWRYSQTLLYRWHPLNMDTSILRTVCFVPMKRKPLHFF